MTNKFKKIFLVFSIFLFLFLPLLVLALTFKPQVIPGGAKEFGADPGGTIFYYFGEIYKWAVPAIGVIAVIMIMIAGFQWMLAGGNATKVSAAKTRMTNSVVGLILVIGAYSILNFINPALVKSPKLKIEGIELKELPGLKSLECKDIKDINACHKSDRNCLWEEGKCKEFIKCEEAKIQTMCKASYCQWKNGVCELLKCKDAKDDKACYAIPTGCLWKKEEKKCVESSEGPTEQLLECKDMFNEDECLIHPRGCQWKDGKCVKK